MILLLSRRKYRYRSDSRTGEGRGGGRGGIGERSLSPLSNFNYLKQETHHRDDRWWRVAVPQSARLLVRRGVEIVLSLLHGVLLMQRLLRLLLMLLLQAANAGLRTAKTGRCAVRGADLPCNLPIALRNTDIVRLITLANASIIIFSVEIKR